MTIGGEKWQGGRRIAATSEKEDREKEQASRKPNRETRECETKYQPTRAINEDDDGYDPYSDLHDKPVKPPLFEADPWD